MGKTFKVKEFIYVRKKLVFNIIEKCFIWLLDDFKHNKSCQVESKDDFQNNCKHQLDSGNSSKNITWLRGEGSEMA